MLVLRVPRHLTGLTFNHDNQGLAVWSNLEVHVWSNLASGVRPRRFKGQHVRLVDFLAGGTHVILNQSKYLNSGVTDDIWSHPLAGGEGHRIASADHSLRFVCSPTEPMLIVFDRARAFSILLL
jgi:hypothetical protein